MKIGETLKMISTETLKIYNLMTLDSLKQGLEKTMEENDKFIFIIRKTTQICLLYNPEVHQKIYFSMVKKVKNKRTTKRNRR